MVRIISCAARVVLLVWLISFTFYAAIVIPAGTAALGATAQGLVTQRVTGFFNWFGMAMIVLLPTLRPLKSRGFWIVWAVMLLCQICLFPLRTTLTGMLDLELGAVREDSDFYQYHRYYLWVSTTQWLTALAALWMDQSNSTPR